MRRGPRPDARELQGTGGAVVVVFGSSGHLATRRLAPAIERIGERGMSRGGVASIGVDRRRGGRRPPSGRFSFVLGDAAHEETYRKVRAALRKRGGTGQKVLFYLATDPGLFTGVVQGLKRAGLTRGSRGWPRIVVEKPFGVDLGSARRLQAKLRGAFSESRTFRADHFLAKEEALEIGRLRLEKVFESVWDRSSIDHVLVMAVQRPGLEGRGRFYDGVGVVRDMVQNHLLQLLCLVAMEPPASTGQGDVGKARAEVLRSMRVPAAGEVAWGQYAGYDREPGVERGSRTATFVAMKLRVDNDRWRGVPFYLRTGKRLARDATEVLVAFRRPVTLESADRKVGGLAAVRFCFDPFPRTVLEPGPGGTVQELAPREGTGDRSGAPNVEYERLLTGALEGDKTLFVAEGFNELSWRLFDPLLRGFEGRSMRPVTYQRGSRGPQGAVRLLEADGRAWLEGRGPFSRRIPGAS